MYTKVQMNKQQAIKNLITMQFNDNKNYDVETKILAGQALTIEDVVLFLNVFKQLPSISVMIKEINKKIEENKFNDLETQLEEQDKKLKNILCVKNVFLLIIRSNTILEKNLLEQLMVISFKLMASENELLSEFGFDFFNALYPRKNLVLTNEQNERIDIWFSKNKNIKFYDQKCFKFVMNILSNEVTLSLKSMKSIASNFDDWDGILEEINVKNKKIRESEEEKKKLEKKKIESSSSTLEPEEAIGFLVENIIVGNIEKRILDNKNKLIKLNEDLKYLQEKNHNISQMKDSFFKKIASDGNISNELVDFLVEIFLKSIDLKSSINMKIFGFQLLSALCRNKKIDLKSHGEEAIVNIIIENFKSKDRTTCKFLLEVFANEKNCPISRFSSKNVNPDDIGSIITTSIALQKEHKDFNVGEIANLLEHSSFKQEKHMDDFVDLFLTQMNSVTLAQKIWEKLQKFKLSAEQEIKIKNNIFERLKPYASSSLKIGGGFFIKILSEQGRVSNNIDDFFKIIGDDYSIDENSLYSEKEINFLLEIANKSIAEESSNLIKKIGFKMVETLCSNDSDIQQKFDKKNMELLMNIFNQQHEIIMSELLKKNQKIKKVEKRWATALLSLCENKQLTEENVRMMIKQFFIWMGKDNDLQFLRKIYLNFEVSDRNREVMLELIMENFNNSNDDLHKARILDILDIKKHIGYNGEKILLEKFSYKVIVKYIESYEILQKKLKDDEVLLTNIKFLLEILQMIATHCKAKDLKDFIGVVISERGMEKVILNVAIGLLNSTELIKDESQNSKDTLKQLFLNEEHNRSIFIFPELFVSLAIIIDECQNFSLSNSKNYFSDIKIKRLTFHIDILKNIAANLSSEQIKLSFEKMMENFQLTVENKPVYGRIAWLEILQGLTENKNLEKVQVGSIITMISENFDKILEKDTKHNLIFYGIMAQSLENPCFLAAKIFLTLVEKHHKHLTKEHVEILTKSLNVFLEKYDGWHGKNVKEQKKEFQLFDDCIEKLKKIKLELNNEYVLTNYTFKFMNEKNNNTEIINKKRSNSFDVVVKKLN